MQIASSQCVRSLKSPRRRGFPVDLSVGFFLYSQERMTCISVGRRPNRLGWLNYRFVKFDGRLIDVPLPAAARFYLWPAGTGPRPADSVSRRNTVFGLVPPMSLHGTSSKELNRVYELWRKFGQMAKPPD